MSRSVDKREDWAGWGVIVGALVFGDLTAGCGLTSNILTGNDGAAGASDDSDGGIAGDRADRGSGGTGSGRAGGAGRAGSGVPDGGRGSTASGGASPRPGEGGVSGGDASVDPADPHAAERKKLADSLCGLLEEYPCLYSNLQLTFPDPKASRAKQAAQCSQDFQVQAYSLFGDGCFAEWAQEMKCFIGLPRQCPCSGNDCDVGLPGGQPSRCPAEEQALNDCWSKSPIGSSGDASGARGTCTWYKDRNGVCGAACMAPAPDPNGAFLSVTCDGSPSGAQACNCEAAGVPLYDWKPNNSLYGASFYADDCPDVGQKMADGACASVLNCCFTWQPVPEPGKQSVQQCSCTSDPKSIGYASCEDLATKGGGQVVDICPQFLPGPATFPQ